MNNTTQEVVRSALGEAVYRAYTNEWRLFNEEAHERSILFHVGRYLAPIVKLWGLNLSVDLEYNRKCVDGGWAPKRLRTWGVNCRSTLGDKSLVYPDLIIHHRPTSERNVLVLEAKFDRSGDPVTHRDRWCESCKLVNFIGDHHYQNAVYLEFSKKFAPKWLWITSDLAERIRTGPIQPDDLPLAEVVSPSGPT